VVLKSVVRERVDTPCLAEDQGGLIRFEEVCKDFTSQDAVVTAVCNVDLTVAAGEFVMLVGPSGCGKSTLLNMASGIFAPTSGQVSYDGRPVAGYNLRVGYMTQNDHLFPWRTVAGNIAVPLEIRGLTKKAINDRVEPLLELVGLSAFSNSYPSQLSGGMRKRTALARVLAYDPETLLMDEPFAALDAQLRLSMQMELRDIVRTLGKTVLFVTHDLDEAAALGDRIVVFTKRPGTIDRIIESPLGKDRDLRSLRHDPEFVRLSSALWDLLMPPDCRSGGARP
jgi:NitT/TauT family transport system ATP-binding protein